MRPVPKRTDGAREDESAKASECCCKMTAWSSLWSSRQLHGRLRDRGPSSSSRRGCPNWKAGLRKNRSNLKRARRLPVSAGCFSQKFRWFRRDEISLLASLSSPRPNLARSPHRQSRKVDLRIASGIHSALQRTEPAPARRSFLEPFFPSLSFFSPHSLDHAFSFAPTPIHLGS